MKTNKLVIFVTLLLFSTVTFAAPTTAASTNKTQQLQQLIQVMGVEGQLTKIVTKFKQRQKMMGNLILQRLYRKYPKINADQKQQLQDAVKNFTTRVENTLQSKEIIGKWVAYMSTELSETEVQKLLAFYNSSVGKKIISAQQKAENKLINFIIEKQRGTLSEARQELVTKVKSIVKDDSLQ